MSIDPYSAPASAPPVFSGSSQSEVSQGVLAQLAGTKPWVRFMSVLMFVGAGFMLIAAVGIGILGSFAPPKAAAGAAPFQGGMMVGIAILYALLSVLYIYPALKLWKYATYIGTLLGTSSMQDLENALSQQRSFWKFLGIMVIALFALYIVIIIAVVAIGGVAAMKAQGH